MFRSVRSVTKVSGIIKSLQTINSRQTIVPAYVIRVYSNKGGKDPCKPPPRTLSPEECSVGGKTSELLKKKPASECRIEHKKKKTEEEECEDEKKGISPLAIGLGIGLLIAALGALAYYMYGKGEEESTPTKPKKKKKKFVRGVKPVIKIPASSSAIPNNVPYLLIGGGTASFSAFRAIKSNDPTAKVLVVSADSHYPYMRPPLSKEVWFYEGERDDECVMFKQWNGKERSVFYEPEDFYVECEDLMSQDNGGVAVARGWKISKIDPIERTAYLEDGRAIKYGKCLIATGSTPQNLKIFDDIPKDIAERIMLYRDLFDFQMLDSILSEEVKNIAVVGGGFLGSELACALARYGKSHGFEVAQIFRESGNMGKVLPEYLSNWTSEKVKSEGVSLYTKSEVQEVTKDKDRVVLHLSTGGEVKVDQVIVAIGVKPNIDLAEPSNLELDEESGGFAVNAELMARSNLWIAGDCASFHDIKLKRRRVEHHDHAVVTGRLAGENMTGAGKPYTHQSMFWSDLGPDVGYEAIGIVDSKLPTVGVFAKGSEKDTPKGVVSETDNADRAACEAMADPVTPGKTLPKDKENFSKGIVFYLKDNMIVGILLWNLFNRMSVARQVLNSGMRYEDMNEVAKLFNIHEEEEEEEEDDDKDKDENDENKDKNS